MSRSSSVRVFWKYLFCDGRCCRERDDLEGSCELSRLVLVIDVDVSKIPNVIELLVKFCMSSSKPGTGLNFFARFRKS